MHLSGVDVSGPVPVVRVEDTFPLVDVLPEHAKLLQVDGAIIVPVKHPCQQNTKDTLITHHVSIQRAICYKIQSPSGSVTAVQTISQAWSLVCHRLFKSNTESSLPEMASSWGLSKRS